MVGMVYLANSLYGYLHVCMVLECIKLA